MIYLGSKRRLAKHILPIILKNRTEGQWYVEPFCGGCNLIDKVTGPRIASDVNFYLIAYFKALQNGWLPPTEFSEDLYNKIKNNKENYPPELVCFAGFPLSFASKFFGGYAKNNAGQRYDRAAFKNAVQQVPYVKDILFHNTEYYNLEIPAKSIIYCDPPYEGATKYKGTDSFDHTHFWQWCREKAAEGYEVYISEYNAPEDFECIFEKEQICNIDNKNLQKENKIEKLFTFKK